MYLETRGPKSRYLKGRAHPQTCRRPLPASAGIRKPQLSSGRRWPHSSLHGGSLASVFTSSRLFTCLWVQISPLIKGPQSSGPQPVPMASPTPLLPQRAHLRVRPHPQGHGSGPQRTLLGTKGNPTPGLGEISPRLKGTQPVSVGAGLIAPGSTAALFRGLSRPYVQGLLPLPGTSRGGASWPSPASLQSASATPGGCWLPCPGYSVGASTAAGLSLPPLHPHPAQDGAPGTNQRGAAGEGRGRCGLLRARHPPV